MCRKLFNQLFYITQYGSSDPLLENYVIPFNTKQVP